MAAAPGALVLNQGMPVQQKASAMGFFQAIYAVGMLLGPIISGQLTSYTGLRGVSLFNSAVAFTAAALAIWLSPSRWRQI